MFSIVLPIDTNRLEQFKNTKEVYDTYEEEKEFLLITRSAQEIEKYLTENNLMKDVRIIPYEHSRGFNPSKAFNIGVKEAKYEQIIISSPEVKPLSDVLPQLKELIGKNVLCQVSEVDETGDKITMLICKGYRDDTPAMYFLAMFNKKDIEEINGWDEEFMKGYAYEDDDFGARWKRAGLPFEIHDEITALHQWHPRSETIKGGLIINQQHFYDNNDNGVIKCKNGLKVL